MFVHPTSKRLCLSYQTNSTVSKSNIEKHDYSEKKKRKVNHLLHKRKFQKGKTRKKITLSNKRAVVSGGGHLISNFKHASFKY